MKTWLGNMSDNFYYDGHFIDICIMQIFLKNLKVPFIVVI